MPYEEDHTRGKDRPVLLVGSHGRYLLGLMLTSKDHDGDDRRSEDYVDIGTGPWDRQWRPSEARLDRVLQIRPGRRPPGGRRSWTPARFRDVAAGAARRHGWSWTADRKWPVAGRCVSAILDSCVSVQVDGHRWLVAIGIPTPLSQWPI